MTFRVLNKRRLTIGSLAIFLATLAAQLVVVNPAVAAPPTFVQARAKEITSGNVNSLGFNSANSAGNLVVVYVLWNNTGSVAVADNRGNSYAAATTRTTWGANWSSQTFYAKNVAAGANTVTATFATPINSFGAIYIHEYAGVDTTNPVDATKSATGTSSAMSSGNFTTSNPSDLLFVGSGSVGNVNQTGSGYTTRLTNYGNRTMDRNVTTAGTYTATARQNSNGWVMQVVAFGGTSTDPTPPSVSLTAPADGAQVSEIVNISAEATDNVGVIGVQFMVDGLNTGVEDTVAPYGQPWDSRTATNGVHTLTARARDAAGNTIVSAPISVNVANTNYFQNEILAPA